MHERAEARPQSYVHGQADKGRQTFGLDDPQLVVDAANVRAKGRVHVEKLVVGVLGAQLQGGVGIAKDRVDVLAVLPSVDVHPHAVAVVALEALGQLH